MMDEWTGSELAQWQNAALKKRIDALEEAIWPELKAGRLAQRKADQKALEASGHPWSQKSPGSLLSAFNGSESTGTPKARPEPSQPGETHIQDDCPIHAYKPGAMR